MSAPQLLFHQDALICHFVKNKLAADIDEFGPCRTIGIVKDDQLLAGIVFNNYFGRDIQATIASCSKLWATRRILQAIFAYPFIQLDCVRITAQTRNQNNNVKRFLQKLGFRSEGLLRQWYQDDDAAIYGLLKSECRWIV